MYDHLGEQNQTNGFCIIPPSSFLLPLSAMQSLNEINVAIMLLDIRWNGITSFTSFTSASTPTEEGSLKVRRDRGRERGRDSVREGSLKVRRELCVVCCVLCAVCCMLYACVPRCANTNVVCFPLFRNNFYIPGATTKAAGPYTIEAHWNTR